MEESDALNTLCPRKPLAGSLSCLTRVDSTIKNNNLLVSDTVAVLRRDDASIAEVSIIIAAAFGPRHNGMSDCFYQVQKLVADANGGTPSLLSWQAGAGFYEVPPATSSHRLW